MRVFTCLLILIVILCNVLISLSMRRSAHKIINDFLPVFDKTHNLAQRITSNVAKEAKMFYKLMTKTLREHQEKYKERLGENLYWIQYDFNNIMMKVGMASNNSFQILKCHKYLYDFLFYITISYEAADNACHLTAQRQIENNTNKAKIFSENIEQQRTEHASIENMKTLCYNEHSVNTIEECLIEKLYLYYKTRLNHMNKEANQIVASISQSVKPILDNLFECSEVAFRKYNDSLEELLEMLEDCFNGNEFNLPFRFS